MSQIKIRCPWCSSVLTVNEIPGIESKNVNCPVCKNKSPFVNFKKVVPAPPKPAPATDATNYVGEAAPKAAPGQSTPTIPPMGMAGQGPQKNADSATVLPSDLKNIKGSIHIPSTGETFKLQPGHNIIGRRASQSNANIQISTSQSMISREHLVIDVTAYYFMISLAKDKVNPTYVGMNRLMAGDALLLNDGDVIKLPGGVDVIFHTTK